jgi:hypothetical protein
MGKLLANPSFYHALVAFGMSTGIAIGPGQLHNIMIAGTMASGAIHAITILRAHL